MNGILTCVEGQPRSGKGVEFVRQMLEAAAQGCSIATNFAVTDVFIAEFFRLNPSGRLVRYQIRKAKEGEEKWVFPGTDLIDESRHWYQFTPKGCRVFLDETGQKFKGMDHKDIRTAAFDSANAQFGKFDWSITFAAQEFGSVVKTMRDKTRFVTVCTCIRFPKKMPFSLGAPKGADVGLPLLFVVRTYTNSIGDERSKKPVRRKFYWWFQASKWYPYFDSEANADEGLGLFNPPTWEELGVPDVVTNPGVVPAGGVSVNVAAPVVPKKKVKWWVIVLLLVAGVYVYGKVKQGAAVGAVAPSGAGGSVAAVGAGAAVRPVFPYPLPVGVCGHSVAFAGERDCVNVGGRVGSFTLLGFDDLRVELGGADGVRVRVPFGSVKGGVSVASSGVERTPPRNVGTTQPVPATQGVVSQSKH